MAQGDKGNLSPGYATYGADYGLGRDGSVSVGIRRTENGTMEYFDAYDGTWSRYPPSTRYNTVPAWDEYHGETRRFSDYDRIVRGNCSADWGSMQKYPTVDDFIKQRNQVNKPYSAPSSTITSKPMCNNCGSAYHEQKDCIVKPPKTIDELYAERKETARNLVTALADAIDALKDNDTPLEKSDRAAVTLLAAFEKLIGVKGHTVSVLR